MTNWTDHLIILPILLPLAASALMLLFDERRYALKRAIGLATTLALLAISVALLQSANAAPAARVYLLGDWPTSVGIVLVADRLAAVMVLLAAVLGLVNTLYAFSRCGPCPCSSRP